MPAVTFNLTDKFREKLLDGTSGIDLEYSGAPVNAVLTCMILSALTIDQNTDITIGDCAVFTEVTGTGYTAGGNELANATVTLDGAGAITVDADDPADWAEDAGGFSDGLYSVIAMKNAGASSTWEILGYSAAYASVQGNVGGVFSNTIHASGLFQAAR